MITRRSAYALLALATLLFACPILRAQSTAAAADRESDHAALRALAPLYEQAVNEHKLDLLKPYLDPGFSGVMVTGDQVDGFESLQAYWKRVQGLIGETGKYTVKLQIADRSMMSGDLAVAHGTTQEQVLTSTGKVFQWEGRWTAAFRKVGQDWKVLRVHASMDPVNNAFVSGAVRGWAWFWGLIGVATGVVAGWLSAALLRRRKVARV